jgi:hypothetical protein
MESGGIYHHDIDGAFEQASKMHERYTRPIENKLIRELLDKKPRPDLAWFGIEKMPAPKGHKETPPLFKGEKSITLKMEGNSVKKESQLENGYVPANAACPFKDKCELTCPKKEATDRKYSCGAARGFDIVEMYKTK